MGNSAVYAIKITIIIAITLAFVVALNFLISGLVVFATSSVLGEIVGLISIYLPFSPGYFFGLIIAVINAILAFLVAKKIYEISIKSQESA